MFKPKMPKKQKEEIIEIPESTNDAFFPSAKDILSETASHWITASAEEILQKIKTSSSAGNREANFYNKKISLEDQQALNAQGYKVIIAECSDAPYFKVSW